RLLRCAAPVRGVGSEARRVLLPGHAPIAAKRHVRWPAAPVNDPEENGTLATGGQTWALVEKAAWAQSMSWAPAPATPIAPSASPGSISGMPPGVISTRDRSIADASTHSGWLDGFSSCVPRP